MQISGIFNFKSSSIHTYSLFRFGAAGRLDMISSRLGPRAVRSILVPFALLVIIKTLSYN